jgi:4-amino-4-deoxychorismate lyase
MSVSPPRRVLDFNAPWSVGVLTTPLTIHPHLAGLKTLNRLDSILARLELSHASQWDEGLMTDGRGQIISASMGNVFFCFEQEGWVTPTINDCGINGCMRRFLVSHWPSALGSLTQRSVGLSELEHVNEAFVTNSLLPVQPIAWINGRGLRHTDGARRVLSHLEEHQ